MKKKKKITTATITAKKEIKTNLNLWLSLDIKVNHLQTSIFSFCNFSWKKIVSRNFSNSTSLFQSVPIVRTSAISWGEQKDRKKNNLIMKQGLLWLLLATIGSLVIIRGSDLLTRTFPECYRFSDISASSFVDNFSLIYSFRILYCINKCTVHWLCTVVFTTVSNYK